VRCSASATTRKATVAERRASDQLDSKLDAAQKEALLRIYKSFVMSLGRVDIDSRTATLAARLAARTGSGLPRRTRGATMASDKTKDFQNQRAKCARSEGFLARSKRGERVLRRRTTTAWPKPPMLDMLPGPTEVAEASHSRPSSPTRVGSWKLGRRSTSREES
jgi:ribosomal protein L34